MEDFLLPLVILLVWNISLTVLYMYTCLQRVFRWVGFGPKVVIVSVRILYVGFSVSMFFRVFRFMCFQGFSGREVFRSGQDAELDNYSLSNVILLLNSKAAFLSHISIFYGQSMMIWSLLWLVSLSASIRYLMDHGLIINLSPASTNLITK